MNFEPKNILIRLPNWIGDAVMASPVIAGIKERFTQSKITLMGKESICSLFYKDPSVDAFFILGKNQPSKELLKELQVRKFDWALLLTNSFSSAWLLYRAKIPYRVGYSKEMRKWLLTDSLAYPKEKKIHQVELYQKLIHPLGNVEKRLPKLFLSDQEIKGAQDFLDKCEVFQNHLLIGVNPTAAYGPSKCWPEHRFRHLAQKLLEEQNIIVFFFGDPASEEKVQRIAQDLGPRCFNLAGKTSLRQLMALIHRCDLFLSNDSGPMHMADALGTKGVALFGSTSPEATGPLQKARILKKSVECSPCFKRECPIDFRCMMSLSVEEVYQVMSEELSLLKEGKQ